MRNAERMDRLTDGPEDKQPENIMHSALEDGGGIKMSLNRSTILNVIVNKNMNGNHRQKYPR